MLVRVALVVLLAVTGACGGDDDTTSSSGTAVTEAPASDAPEAPDGATPECETIQVLLKLDVTDEQRDEVAEVLDGIEGIEHEPVEAASDAEPSLFLVTASTEDASGAVGSELEGHPAVVSVVFPEQLC